MGTYDHTTIPDGTCMAAVLHLTLLRHICSLSLPIPHDLLPVSCCPCPLPTDCHSILAVPFNSLLTSPPLAPSSDSRLNIALAYHPILIQPCTGATLTSDTIFISTLATHHISGDESRRQHHHHSQVLVVSFIRHIQEAIQFIATLPSFSLTSSEL